MQSAQMAHICGREEDEHSQTAEQLLWKCEDSCCEEKCTGCPAVLQTESVLFQ